jgi:ectoine hydroxylase-related dioxygenase (phytanoyl-CoA dioxygenase family)
MSNEQALRDVSEQEILDYARDGVVILKGIYPPAWVDRLEAQLDDMFRFSAERTKALAESLLSGASRQGSAADMVQSVKAAATGTPGLAIEGTADEVTGASYVETDASSWHEGIRAHNLHSPLARIIHQLARTERVVFYSDQLFYKGAGSRLKTPWHQDKPYFLVDGGEVAVAWVPVDVVDKEVSAMGYVRGSHKWGKTFKPSDFQTETGTFPEIGGIDLSGLDDLDHTRLRDEDIVYFDAEPGDVIVHHWATLHGSSGNTSSGRIRRAASIRFACDGCVFYQRPSSPEPFRHTIDIEPGTPLGHPQSLP